MGYKLLVQRFFKIVKYSTLLALQYPIIIVKESMLAYHSSVPLEVTNSVSVVISVPPGLLGLPPPPPMPPLPAAADDDPDDGGCVIGGAATVGLRRRLPL